MWTWSLHSYGDNIQSKNQCGYLPSFPSTMAYKYRSPVTKTRGLTELNIVFSLDGGRVQLFGRILNCVLPSCVQPRNIPEHILFILSPIVSNTVYPRISPLYLLYLTSASLNILVMFLPYVNFALIFMLALNSPSPWSPPLTSLIDMIGVFCFPLCISYGIYQSLEYNWTVYNRS